MDNSTGGPKVKTIDFRDKEWSDQYSSLSKMLDHYLVSASTTNTGAQTNLQAGTQPATKNEPYSYRPSASSVNTGTLPMNDTQNQNTSSYSKGDQLSNGYHRTNVGPNPKTASNPYLKTAQGAYPQQIEDPSKTQYKPNYQGGKKSSPEKSSQNKTSSKVRSPDRNSPRSPNNNKSSHRKSPSQVEPEQNIHQLSPHTDYGPRERRPYGQAQSPTRSPQRDQPLQNSSPHHQRWQSNELLREKSSPNLGNKNAYISYVPTYRGRTPSNISVGSFQGTGTANPYLKQDYTQSSRNLNSLSSIPVSSVPDFQIQTSRSIYHSSVERKGYGGVPLGSQDHIAYSSRINNNKIVASGSPGQKLANYFRSSQGSASNLSNSGKKVVASPQRIISPKSYYGSSPDSRSSPRKDSTENLVGENQEKFEQSVILQKYAEQVGKAQASSQPTSQGSPIQGRGGYLQSMLGNKASNPPTSRLGLSPHRRNLSGSGGKLMGMDPLNYTIIVEQYSDGTRYEGEKYMNKRHGRGTFYYKEGFRYEGNWEDGVMRGYGILWLDDKNKIYEGEWDNNVFHGRGTLYNAECNSKCEFNGTDFRMLRGGWTKLDGLFDAGVKQGLATLFIANGDVFVGTFARDVVHGRGTYTPKNGKAFFGLWRENVLLEKY